MKEEWWGTKRPTGSHPSSEAFLLTCTAQLLLFSNFLSISYYLFLSSIILPLYFSFSCHPKLPLFSAFYITFFFTFSNSRKPPLSPSTNQLEAAVLVFFLCFTSVSFKPSKYLLTKRKEQERSMVEFDYEELVKATGSFSPSRLLGKGSHGSVYKGTLEENKLVAIKKSSVGSDHVSIDNSKKLENEICVLSSLRESPYVINFLGTTHDDDHHSTCKEKNRLLVMEHMPNGSLHDLLHVDATPPSWPKRVEIAIQIARAIQFLHEGKPLVIHRDIKSANVLFDLNWKAKLADFGLAVLRVDSSSSPDHETQPAGTIGYLDPCYTTPSKLSTKNDVFSYGVVLLEIVSCQKAIDVSRLPASIVDWAVPLIEKQRLMEICDARIALPTFMEGTIKHLLYVASRCVSCKEENRPSISEIVMGMDKNCLAGRVKISSWTSLMRSVMLMRRPRKFLEQWQEEKCDDLHSNISKGKVYLWEILANITQN